MSSEAENRVHEPGSAPPPPEEALPPRDNHTPCHCPTGPTGTLDSLILGEVLLCYPHTDETVRVEDTV